MIQRIVLGILGGALIALSVFMVGNSVEFDSGAPESGVDWVVLSAGAVVAFFAIVGVRTLIAFGAGAAAAVAAISIIEAARADALEVTAQLVVIVVGVLAALAATIHRRKKTVVVEAEPVADAPVVVEPVVVEPVAVEPVVVQQAVVEPVAVKPAAKRTSKPKASSASTKAKKPPA
jgi:hypothetical protein